MQDLVNKIVDANSRFLSWRNRLGWILDLLAGSTFEMDTEHLAYIAVYLRFIGTGEVPCSEEGGHYRPSHNAKIAQQIFNRLSEITTPENVFIIRKIYPWPPSFDTSFTRAEPLTRIRDIAHRNDIPGELKREIKHTLQNKLHRSAGPEDLVTAEGLLKKITAPGASYPHSFIEEFRRFNDELKEFFNALSLDERLKGLAENINSNEAALIRNFLDIKENIDTPGHILTALGLLTELRSFFCAQIEMEKGPKIQRLQMADIGLEDFSFVLLARLNNHFEMLKNSIPWKSVWSSLGPAIENLRLSGFDYAECLAIESELRKWSHELSARNQEVRNQEELLRLKATLERCARLAEDYCNKILLLFPEKAERLGRALGVAAHAIRVFSESDIRSHPVFQMSRLVNLVLKSIRTLANLSPWDVIVPGSASGRLVIAVGLGNLPEKHDGPLIALLEIAEGDEEIPASVAGIIVAREIPHLSHLAVRARQNHVIFAACEDRERFEELKVSAGPFVDLDVADGKVNLETSSGHEKRQINKIRLPAIKAPDVIFSSANKLHQLLQLSGVTPEIAGGKAYAARQLEELSGLKPAGFKTAPGLVIPFGVMEASLTAEPAMEKEYYALVEAVNKTPDDFAGPLKKLREIVNHVTVPAAVVSGVIKAFAPDERLFVRSSSNCEDMEKSAGAGLYDSVANVQPSDVDKAILKVWASLWNNRAVLNRRNTLIRHDSAHMAVLIQKMIIPEFSFIMHTVNPVTYNAEEVYIELAVGMGETLASAGTPGVPYRMVCNKQTKEVRMLAFASFSHALWPAPSGGTIMKNIDYSGIGLSGNRTYRNLMGRRLGSIGQFVEKAFGHPQDIEGVVSGDEVYLVQSRAQQGNV